MSIYNKTWLVGLIIRLVLKLVFRRDWQREIFLQRKENEILLRQVKKPQLTDNDRVFFCLISTLLRSYTYFFDVPGYQNASRSTLVWGLAHSGQRALQGMEWLTWILSPLPVDPYLYNRKTRIIHDKVRKDPSYKLSDNE